MREDGDRAEGGGALHRLGPGAELAALVMAVALVVDGLDAPVVRLAHGEALGVLERIAGGLRMVEGLRQDAVRIEVVDELRHGP